MTLQHPFDTSLADGPNYEYERDVMGDVKIEVVSVPLSECKIIFLDMQGNPVLPGHAQDDEIDDKMALASLASVAYIRKNTFQIEHPKIDPLLVSRVSLVMDYAKTGYAQVRIEMRVGKLIEPETP